MMVQETCMDIFSEYQDFQFPARHCVQCGEIIDPGILLNRMKSFSSGEAVCPVISSAIEPGHAFG